MNATMNLRSSMLKHATPGPLLTPPPRGRGLEGGLASKPLPEGGVGVGSLLSQQPVPGRPTRRRTNLCDSTTSSLRHSPTSSRAFTLIELLVVIAIISLLISLLLPSLGTARKTAWNVMCQSNERQIGIACQSYFDQQKDPQWFDLHMGPVSQAFWHVGVVDPLSDQMGGYHPKAFDCPAAKGLSSVRAPQNIQYLQQGLRVFTLPFPGFMDPNAEVTKYTEYWFNDSTAWEDTPNPPPRGNNYDGSYSGVSNGKIRLVRHFDRVVLCTDALDEFPRHTGRADRRNANTADNSYLSTGGQNNFLFGDLSVRAIDYATYELKRDKYKSASTFYNWGHYYPDRPENVDDGQTLPY